MTVGGSQPLQDPSQRSQSHSVDVWSADGLLVPNRERVVLARQVFLGTGDKHQPRNRQGTLPYGAPDLQAVGVEQSLDSGVQ